MEWAHRFGAASTSEEGGGKPEPSGYGRMGASHRLRRGETLFRAVASPPKAGCHVLRGESRCAVLRRPRRRAFSLRLGCVAGPLGTLAWRLLRLGRLLRPTGPVLVASVGEILGWLFERRLFLGLVVGRTAERRGRHPQRGGQLGQGERGGPKTTAAFLDLVDGHSR